MFHAQAQFSRRDSLSSTHAGPERAIFSAAERQAIEVAWIDSRSRLKIPVPGWVGQLFGLREPRKLADPALEALRRFSIGMLTRRCDAGALAELSSAGFVPEKIEALRAALGRSVPVAVRTGRLT